MPDRNNLTIIEVGAELRRRAKGAEFESDDDIAKALDAAADWIIEEAARREREYEAAMTMPVETPVGTLEHGRLYNVTIRKHGKERKLSGVTLSTASGYGNWTKLIYPSSSGRYGSTGKIGHSFYSEGDRNAVVKIEDLGVLDSIRDRDAATGADPTPASSDRLG